MIKKILLGIVIVLQGLTLLGQWTIAPFRVPPQCEATCFVHWYGVSIACAHATE